MTLPASEMKRRRRLVRTHEWSEVWITLTNGEEFFAKRCSLVNDDIVRFVESDGTVHDVQLVRIHKAVH
jgi:hypothetical protein